MADVAVPVVQHDTDDEGDASIPVPNMDPSTYYDESENDTGGTGGRKMARRLNVTSADEKPFDISYHPGRVLLYSPPRQRQKWGETQVLPRVNWGDLFFDLFYVAATYNVSYILVDDPAGEGLLYAAGTFLPVMGLWIQKTGYDSRFVTEDDLYHRCYQIAVLVILATAVLHIRPIKILSNADNEISMFVFSLMLVLERVFSAIQSLEIYMYGVGQKVLRSVALRDMKFRAISTCCYIAAMIVAAVEYFGRNGSDNTAGRALAETEEDGNDVEEDGKVAYRTTNVPIYLILFGYIANQVYLFLKVRFFFPGGGRHKEFMVPMNISFVLHRNGEWIMLMLGESIFSLLIVDVPDEGKYFFETFYCGILTVIFLQYLHFRSQPFDPDSHALRRNKDAGIAWSMFHQVYSFFLVALGAAFTIFLTASGDKGNRRLAGGGSGSDPAAILQPAANLFCGSLAIVFFCLDFMTLLHLGLKESHGRCICKRTRKKNVKGIFLLVLRLGLLAATATMSQWETRPWNLSLIGLMFILAQLILRMLGGKYLTHNQVHALDASGDGHDTRSEKNDAETGDATWPNVTHARAEPSEGTEK